MEKRVIGSVCWHSSMEAGATRANWESGLCLNQCRVAATGNAHFSPCPLCASLSLLPLDPLEAHELRFHCTHVCLGGLPPIRSLPTGDERSAQEEMIEFRSKGLRVVRKMGNGSFADVFLVHNDAGESYVVKRAKDGRPGGSEGEHDSVTQGEGNAARLASEHVVKLYDIWTEPGDVRTCMLMEYCDGGDLGAALRAAFPIRESTVIALFAQLLIGLDHIHLRHILHRDVKLENILLHGGSWRGDILPTAKLSDFGLSKSLLHTDAPAIARLGTPAYLSPELLSGCRYTRKTDIWSMGVVFYKLLTNSMPFVGADMMGLTQAVMRAAPENPVTVSEGIYSPVLGDLVLRMLTKSRKNRPTARELLASPVFAPIYSSWPWKSPAFTHCVGVFACRRRAVVNVRAAPSLGAKKVGAARYGDQLYVKRTVIATTGPAQEQLLWFRVVSPLDGFCLVGYGANAFFQLFENPTRDASFPDSPTSLNLDDDSSTMLSCSVEPSSISPLFDSAMPMQGTRTDISQSS